LQFWEDSISNYYTRVCGHLLHLILTWLGSAAACVILVCHRLVCCAASTLLLLLKWL